MSLICQLTYEDIKQHFTTTTTISDSSKATTADGMYCFVDAVTDKEYCFIDDVTDEKYYFIDAVTDEDTVL